MGKSFLICSGKGGTGKTTSAVNLGAALAQRNIQTAIVDANLLTPNVAFHLKVPPGKYINDVIDGSASLSDATYMLNENLSVIPASFSVNSLAGFEPRKFSRIVELVERNSAFTLIDCAPGLGREVVNALASAANTILIVNPEIPSIADAAKAIHVTKGLGVSVEGVIINRTGRFRQELSPEKISSVLEVPVLGSVPEDSSVSSSIYFGKPVVEMHPFSPASRAFKRIAAGLAGKPYEEEGLVERIKYLLGKY